MASILEVPPSRGENSNPHPGTGKEKEPSAAVADIKKEMEPSPVLLRKPR